MKKYIIRYNSWAGGFNVLPALSVWAVDYMANNPVLYDRWILVNTTKN